jgi:HK97 gp10 family phage protein
MPRGSFTFRFYESQLTELLKGPEGAVGRDLQRRAIRVEGRAKMNASGRPGPRVRTGRLRSSITHQLGRDSRGLYADIGSNVEYAKYLEFGTSRMPPYPFLRPALNVATL